MMRATAPPASRAAILKYAHRLDQVRKGAALLTRKRHSLVDELLRRARTAVTSREAIDAQARRAWGALWKALAASGSSGLSPLAWPERSIDVDIQTADIWGIHVAQLTHRPPLVRGVASRGAVAGPGEAAAHEAARQFEILIEQLLDAAPREHVIRRLGDALSRTTRLVNTLEQRVAVTLAAQLTAMRQTLAEREREEQVRIMRLLNSSAGRHRARLPSHAVVGQASVPENAR